jgi:hypothetical protein
LRIGWAGLSKLQGAARQKLPHFELDRSGDASVLKLCFLVLHSLAVRRNVDLPAFPLMTSVLLLYSIFPVIFRMVDYISCRKSMWLKEVEVSTNF